MLAEETFFSYSLDLCITCCVCVSKILTKNLYDFGICLQQFKCIHVMVLFNLSSLCNGNHVMKSPVQSH